MRNVWIVVASGLLAFANFVKSQETGRTLYSSRYDNLDIDTILSSNRLVNNYVDCLLSRKPCPPEGKDLKRILPEALRTKCGRCSSTQKENALKIITTLYYSYPDQYQALRERWDPSGEYHRRFEEYLRGIQFNQIGGNGNGNGGPSERPVRNDFDRDQSQILLQTLILSTTTAQPPVPEQRPTQLASAQLTQPQPTAGPLSNRFGDDDTPVTTSTTQRPPVVVQQTQPTTTQRPVVVRQTTTRPPTQRTTSRFVETVPAVQLVQGQFQVVAQPPPPQLVSSQNFQQQPQPSNQGGQPAFVPNNVIDNFFIPPGQQNPQQNNGGGAQSPIVGLFNQIGNKLATTADAIAGMLRKTVDVIVTSHIQSHQRALRSFGAQ
ncbi:uncharacterized protein LOC120427056 isoform X6 [Culex pipiens pallens]|uniref:uncharacterized protein LOC120427056 isoform X6 n=1 Tax=Culex pipiens pallens TaxID=42434 RepID=UPI0022AA301E|nr:uncharacterized protein LOC120427056 isoform X6 [Culex pipiens pallens]